MHDTKYDLIATKIFSKDYPNTILLGEWCKPNETKIDNNTIRYHWKDKKKLLKDCEYLEQLYEKVLSKLKDFLNKHHKVSYSVRFWRIFLGPWLGYFVQIIFDRYENIQRAINKYDIKKFYDIDFLDKDFTAKSIEDFLYLINTDTWNQKIYSDIITHINLAESKKIKFKKFKENKENQNEFFFARKFLIKKKMNMRSLILRKYEKLFSKVLKNQKYLIIDTYLGNKDEIKLNFSLNQMPTFYYDHVIPNIHKDNEFRKKNILSIEAKNNFEKFLENILIKHLPITFNEGFEEMEKIIRNISWPEKPIAIFTSHALTQKTVPSLYTAFKTENNCKLIHGQHGGVFGQLKYMWHEKHEKKISDTFLNWGWDNSHKSKPIGIIKPIDHLSIKKRIARKKVNLLLVTRTQPLYSNELLDTRFRSGEMKEHIKECKNFISALNSNIRENNLIIRLHAKKYGWNEFNKFKSLYSNIKIDSGETKITNLLLDSRVCVFTYNATGYLETLAINIPTIIFWNPEENLLREDAKYYLDILKKNKIFFDDPKLASEHINSIWKNVDQWWWNKNTQEAVNVFCKKYSKVNKNKVKEIKEILIGKNE